MSRRFDRTPPLRWATFVLFSAAWTIWFAGCGGGESQEPLTAASSGYEVADDSEDASRPPADTAESAAAQDTASAPDAGAATSVANGLGAMTPPTDAPGVVQPPPTMPPMVPDAVASAGDFAIPDSEEALIEFLATMQERSMSPQGASQMDVLNDLLKTHQARILAAEKLLQMTSKEEALISAAQSKLDAMRALTLMIQQIPPEVLQQFQLPAYDKQLNGFCRELMKHENPKVAILGRITLFGLSLDGLMSGQVNDVTPILTELKALVADSKDDMGVLTITSQAAIAMQSVGFQDAALEAYKAIQAAYENSTDPEVAAEAKKLATRARIIETDFETKIRAMFEDKPGAAEEAMVTLRSLLNDGAATPDLLDLAIQAAQLFEMMDHHKEAGETFDLMEQNYAGTTDQELAERVKTTVEQGRKRIALIGTTFTFEGVKRDGTPFDASKYAGKIVLVDFWATWCGPCLQEIPNLLNLHKAYNEKGFEVVGVNLDDDPATVERFLNYQPLPWESIYGADAQSRGWNHPMAATYGVDGIPFMVLLDREGKVLGLHMRGQKLEDKLAELLGPLPAADDAPAPTGGEGALPAAPGTSPAAPPAASNPPAESAPAAPPLTPPAGSGSQFRDPRGSEAYFVCFQEGSGDANPLAVENPYLPRDGLSVMELIDFIFTMQDKPKSIQARPGFTEAIAVAADRILAADASDKQRVIAAKAKSEFLHQRACEGDEEADTRLAEFIEQMKDSPIKEIAAEVQFLSLEQRALAVDDLPLEDVPALLEELTKFFTDEKLTDRHLRLASSAIHAVNRLEDIEQREEHFQELGGLYAKSESKTLARYGARLTKKPASNLQNLVGQPLELEGITDLGVAFDWTAYRGKVVLVDFWASWCGPCVREIPEVKEMYESLKDQGFDVVGVNLDRSDESLAKFLEQNELPWQNLVGEDARQIAERCSIRGIPTMMLVDVQGKVVAVSHKSAELATKAKQLLPKKAA